MVAGGSVARDTLSRCLPLLADLLAVSRAAGCARPVLIGTNALREAGNAEEIRETITRETALPVRVLSQREEAALGYLGAAFFSGRRDRLCLIDIGGTSTEISWGTGVEMEGFAGYPLGTHRVSASLAGSEGGAPSAARLAVMLADGPSRLRAGEMDVYPLPRGIEDSTMLVTGGTATTLAMIRRLMRGLPPVFEGVEKMTIDELVEVRGYLARMFGAGTEASLPFDAGRIALLPAGALLAESLLRMLAVRTFAVTVRDLRWGAVLAGEGLDR